MNRIVIRIWYWALIIMSFTAILTFILTLVVCNQVLKNSGLSPRKLPHISELAKEPAYPYFVSGFVILTPQFILGLLGRLQFLLQSQKIIHPAILYAIHSVAIFVSIFMLMMAIVSVHQNVPIHLTGAIGMFSSLLTYCILHTMVVFYLFIRRSRAPQHSNILYTIWFFVCCLVLIICFSIWGATGQSIPQYIASSAPFLYIIGFVPQFWKQMKTNGERSNSPLEGHNMNRISEF